MKKGLFVSITLVFLVVLLARAEDPASQPTAGTPAGNKVVTPSGLTIITTAEGYGARVGDTVAVHYTGMFADGKKFDSSLDRDEPFPVTIGETAVIKGWTEGLVGLKFGEKRRLVIPPDLAYGPNGRDIIPPNATLTFEIECVGISRRP